MKILGNEDVALHIGFDLAYLSSQKSSDYINVQHAALAYEASYEFGFRTYESAMNADVWRRLNARRLTDASLLAFFFVQT